MIYFNGKKMAMLDIDMYLSQIKVVDNLPPLGENNVLYINSTEDNMAYVWYDSGYIPIGSKADLSNWSFESSTNGGVLNYGSMPVLERRDDNTIVGNINGDIVLTGVGERPVYLNDNSEVKEIALLEDVGTGSADAYSKSETNALLENKADKSTTYSKTETDTLLNTKSDKSTTYTKEETRALIDSVAAGDVDLTNYYTKSETDNKIVEKLDEKQTTEVNCSHETEITGFGEEDCNLIINDQDVVITKIQGQTRRKSLNIISFNNTTKTEYGITWANENGVITLNGTATAGLGIWNNANAKTNLTPLEIDSYTFKISKLSGNGDFDTYGMIYYTTDGTTWNVFKQFNTYDVVNFTISEKWLGYYCRVVCITDNTYTNLKIGMMLVKGTYTTETMPPFEPYDNTLVNSKCDFVSAGRNLLDFSSIVKSGWYGRFANVTLVKGQTYTIDYGYNVTHGSNLKFNDIELFEWSNNFRTKTFTYNGETKTDYLYVTYPNENLDITTLSKIMLYVGDTALPYEPYIEDTMKCGLELGAFDYHDNVNHITHRQTSEILTLASGNTIPSGISNGYVGNRDLTETELTNLVAESDIQLVYKLVTETTEENILPSGYKVWYKGMQVQKTETLPYILTKQYAISLASQVLNNVSIDRSQQKQIEELKENKLNSTTSEGFNVESFLKLLGDNVKKTINTTVSATTGSKAFIVESGTVYNGSSTLTILPNSTNKTISNLTIENGTGTVNSNVSYNSSTGVISFTLQGSTASTDIFATVSYDITINQYLENQTSILSEASLEEQIE